MQTLPIYQYWTGKCGKVCEGLPQLLRMLDGVQLMFPLMARSSHVLRIFTDFTTVPCPILVYGQSLHEDLPHLLRMLDVMQLMFLLMARSSPIGIWAESA